MVATQNPLPENATKRRHYGLLLGGIAIAALLLTLLANLLYGAIRNAAERAKLEPAAPMEQ